MQDFAHAVSHLQGLKSGVLTESVHLACFCDDSRKINTGLVFFQSQLSNACYSHGA